MLSINFEDFTWSGVKGVEWAVLEPGIALLVASAPILRPIFDKIIPHNLIRKRFTKKGSSTSHSHIPAERPYAPPNDDDIELLQSTMEIEHSVAKSGQRSLIDLAPPAPVVTTARDKFAD